MKRVHLLISILALVNLVPSAYTKGDENFVKVGESASYENENCDIVLDSGLCLYNGKKLLFDENLPEGLAGFWSFNDGKGADLTGNHNNVKGGIKNGPGYGGSGYSAVIGDGQYITIPASAIFD